MLLKDQEDYITSRIKPFQKEYAKNVPFIDATKKHFGPGYGYIEAQALHGFIRATKPAHIVEVGSGVSTHCMLKACELNAQDSGQQTSFTCIEPHPSSYLRSSKVDLIDKPVESLAPAFIETLDDGDLLFIDSSHAIRIGGDVLYLYSEILPRLKRGVHVHIHDIYFPYTYNSNVLAHFWQWSETALLQAFLAYNNRFSILFCLSYLHYMAPRVLKDVFPEYSPCPQPDGLKPGGATAGGGGHYPSSIYLRVVS